LISHYQSFSKTKKGLKSPKNAKKEAKSPLAKFNLLFGSPVYFPTEHFKIADKI
jgi:hypothetical protein